MLEAILALPVLLYVWAISKRLYYWISLNETQLPELNIPLHSISVIVPVRNEASKIGALLTDLCNQHYPESLLEIIFVDDHSEDRTPEIIQEFITAYSNYKLIQLTDLHSRNGKKKAIEKAIEIAQGEILVFTDGDCRVKPNWLALIEYTFRSTNAICVSGPVAFYQTNTIFHKLQLIEFASLIGIGAASINLHSPNMCNGANIAYSKSAFKAVNGFSGNEHIASGDDEFLMHKFHEKYPGQIVFLKSKDALVYTEPQLNLQAFIQQRIRWASKWKSYKNNKVKFLAVLVFASNLSVLLCSVLFMSGIISFLFFIGLLGIKILIDFIFLYQILNFLDKTPFVWYSIPLQLVYIPYVLFTALKGLKGKYTWKGRTISGI